MTEEEKKEQIKQSKKVRLSFIAIVTLATILVIAAWHQQGQTHKLAVQNQERLEENTATRNALIKGFRSANYDLCKEIETLKGGFRAQAIRNYKNLRRNLKLFGLELTPDVQLSALEERNAQLKRYRGKKGGCKPLLSGK